MITARNVRLLLALASLTALPACSDMFHRGGETSHAAAAAPRPQPVANDMVRQVQDRLKQDGYYKTGPVDGVWGSGTMSAVQNFQRDHSLNPSGQLDVPTLQAMNIANTGNPPPAGTAPYNPNANPAAAPNPNPNTPGNTYPDNRTYSGAPATGPTGNTAAPR